MRAAIPEIAHDKCTGCGDCVEWCPAGVVRLISGKAAIVRPEDCNYCTDCEVSCLPGAIKCPFEIVLVKAEPERSLEEQLRRAMVEKEQIPSSEKRHLVQFPCGPIGVPFRV